MVSNFSLARTYLSVDEIVTLSLAWLYCTWVGELGILLEQLGAPSEYLQIIINSDERFSRLGDRLQLQPPLFCKY
jgi:hypothetical protein